MSKARDIANILSANTAIATDAEVASSVSSAVSTHATAANGHIGRGTTGQRPSSPAIGDTYFDTTLSALISYKSAGWEKVSQDPAPQIASISPTTAGTTGTTITITGSSFKSGLSVQFIGADATSYNAPVATFVGATTATATTPVLSVANEPYDVRVINNDNQFAILDNALDAGGSPTWNTASGTIATIAEQTALNVSVSATDPDGTSIVYSSSNLPVATPTPVTFEVTNSGYGAYNINGSPNAAITLVRGGTYTFNVNASGHPFYIQTTGNGYNSYNVYSTGVTGAGAQVGTVTFVVPSDAPNTLFYQCQYHPAMFGQINIVNATAWVTLNPSTGSLTGTAPSALSSTTYSFNVTASDGVNTSSRAFSIAVTRLVAAVTGGTLFSDSTYQYRVFTSGTSTLSVSTIPLTADILVVAGGGGGGTAAGGGGGAGGVGYTPNATLAIGSYSTSVGTGGAGAVSDGGSGSNGSNSTFNDITTFGGGGGNHGGAGANGGSGGGCGYSNGPGGTATLGTGAANHYGSNGGAYGRTSGGSPYGSSGGGGAGGVGGASSEASGGVGGVGLSTWSSWGAATEYGQNISGYYWFAGGGGGSRDNVIAAGGNGGGGRGGTVITAGLNNAQDGLSNTGGGGGGGDIGTDGYPPTRAGNGGSGIVIVRYTKSQVGA